MMHSPSPAAYAAMLRWAHVPLAMFVLSIVWFVYFHFDAGRLWLAWAASGVRLLALGLNFVTGVNINFREVFSLDPVMLWGGAVVSGPVGVANPWAIVPQIGNVLLLAFVVDASITLWRRGGADARRRAAVVGGGVALCIAAVAGFAALITLGLVHAPTIVMPGVFIDRAGHGLRTRLGPDRGGTAAVALCAPASMRFRAVVEAVPSAILLVDDKGAIALANAQAEGLFGYPRARAGGHAGRTGWFRSAFAARTPACVAPMRRTRRRAPMGAGRELFACRKDGSEFPVEVALSPMPTEEGRFVLASVVDVSERKAAGTGHGAPARRDGAPVARGDAGRAVRIAGPRAEPAADGHPQQCAGGAALPGAEPAALDQIGGDPADIVKSDHRAAR